MRVHYCSQSHRPPGKRHRISRRLSARWVMPSLVLLSAFAVGCSDSEETDNGQAASTGSTETTQSGTGDGSADSNDHAASSIRFATHATNSGLDFQYVNGQEANRFTILESLGGGVAAVDYDGDGKDDLFFAGGGGFSESGQPNGAANGLFRNVGGWRFVSVAEVSGCRTSRFYSHGAIRGDFDSDGFGDVLVTGYGGLQLFRNMGDGTFAESADASGLLDSAWSSSAAWCDLNRDGHLDLYVAHYVDWSPMNDPICQGPEPNQREICPPKSFTGLRDVLFISNGDGTFRDASDEFGLLPEGKGLGVVVADLDGDLDQEIYVANDTVPNFLYENKEGRLLEDVSLRSGTSLSDRGVPDGSMGVDVTDFNLDGRPDLWVVNYESESCGLYQNEGSMFFRPVSQPTGINAVGGLYVGWGTRAFDADLDGDEDFFVSNGHVIRYPVSAPLMQQPLMLRNENGKRFRNVSAGAGEYFLASHMGRGAATTDLDHDGDPDLAVSNMNEACVLLENQQQGNASWLTVELNGTQSARDPIGAVVTATAADGKSQVRQWQGGGSYASTSSRGMMFGFGDAERLESVEVRWPSGIVQDFSDIPINSVVQVVERAMNEEPRRASRAVDGS